jgi:phosphoserine phosphatase SerB
MAVNEKIGYSCLAIANLYSKNQTLINQLIMKDKKQITVIIPALNEEATIGNVVRFARAAAQVTEVIVVDDRSTDATVKEAADAGAKVIISQKRGKGTSMKEGIEMAENELIVFLDADIDPYSPRTIENLCTPLLTDKADFVKGSFARQAGRVTELVAKPLLSILFPELSGFSQPLSGMIAGRKSFFEQVEFADDYGVDVGLLIDMHLIHARVKEVSIGSIENKMKPWRALAKMSKEVSVAIIQRALKKPHTSFHLEETLPAKTVWSPMSLSLNEQSSHPKKIAVFDMDNTLLRGRFIDACADKFEFGTELMYLRSTMKDPVITTKRVAQLLRGKTKAELLEVANQIPLVDDAHEIVSDLKQQGFIVGIISDSYDFVVNLVKHKIGADFAMANELEFASGMATGEVKIPSYFFPHRDSRCEHTICKTNALLELSRKYAIPFHRMMAVGDSHNDLCMIQHAGIGYSFCSADEALNHAADFQIKEYSFKELLAHTL